jgi:hypothetical protein
MTDQFGIIRIGDRPLAGLIRARNDQLGHERDEGREPAFGRVVGIDLISIGQSREEGNGKSQGNEALADHDENSSVRILVPSFVFFEDAFESLCASKLDMEREKGRPVGAAFWWSVGMGYDYQPIRSLFSA